MEVSSFFFSHGKRGRGKLWPIASDLGREGEAGDRQSRKIPEFHQKKIRDEDEHRSKRRHHILIACDIDSENYFNAADSPARPEDWPMDDFESILEDTVNRVRAYKKGGGLPADMTFPDIEKAIRKNSVRKAKYTVFLINELYLLALEEGSKETLAYCYRIVSALLFEEETRRYHKKKAPLDKRRLFSWREELIIEMWLFTEVYESYLYGPEGDTFASHLSWKMNEINELKWEKINWPD